MQLITSRSKQRPSPSTGRGAGATAQAFNKCACTHVVPPSVSIKPGLQDTHRPRPALLRLGSCAWAPCVLCRLGRRALSRVGARALPGFDLRAGLWCLPARHRPQAQMRDQPGGARSSQARARAQSSASSSIRKGRSEHRRRIPQASSLWKPRRKELGILELNDGSPGTRAALARRAEIHFRSRSALPFQERLLKMDFGAAS